jgi:hypothetical protein
MRREMVVDERGHALRATWHPDTNLTVVSVWRGDVCTATVRLDAQAAGRIERLLAAATRQTGSDASPPP